MCLCWALPSAFVLGPPNPIPLTFSKEPRLWCLLQKEKMDVSSEEKMWVGQRQLLCLRRCSRSSWVWGCAAGDWQICLAFFFSCWLYLFFNFILILLKKVPGKRTLFFGCLQELTPFWVMTQTLKHSHGFLWTPELWPHPLVCFVPCSWFALAKAGAIWMLQVGLQSWVCSLYWCF